MTLEIMSFSKCYEKKV